MVQISQLFCDIWIARYFAHKVRNSLEWPSQMELYWLAKRWTAGFEHCNACAD